MNFHVPTIISNYSTIKQFFDTLNLSSKDLIVSNTYVLSPQINVNDLQADILWQENYGKGEPTDEMVDAILKDISNKGYERIIAVGGGTVIDIAKLLVFGDGLSCEQIFIQGSSLPKKRKLITVPTTCGTGSEVTMISVISFPKKNTKMGLAVPAMFAEQAALIPRLLVSQPLEVFAASAIDALIHAVESYVSPKATVFSKAMSKESIQLLIKGFRKIKSTGKAHVPDEILMYDFINGATMAGVAFGNAGVGAVHALSLPIGARYHVTHGKSNWIFFVAVFKKYKAMGCDLNELEDILATALACANQEVWQTLTELASFLLERLKLSSLGVTEQDINDIAASVIKNQQRLLINNPITFTEQTVKEVYMSCL